MAPVLTLKGRQNDTVAVSVTYTDPGATATDDKDGDISSSIVVTGSVNTNVPGLSYTLTYNVADGAGNHAVALNRMVYVRPAPAYIQGNYQVACTSATYNPGVDPVISAVINYTSNAQLSGQSGTVVALTALCVGPVTGPTGQFTVNGPTFSVLSSPVNAPALQFASCTGTVSASKATFTLDAKYYDKNYPNKYYETRNVFTRQ